MRLCATLCQCKLVMREHASSSLTGTWIAGGRAISRIHICLHVENTYRHPCCRSRCNCYSHPHCHTSSMWRVPRLQQLCLLVWMLHSCPVLLPCHLPQNHHLHSLESAPTSVKREGPQTAQFGVRTNTRQERGPRTAKQDTNSQEHAPEPWRISPLGPCVPPPPPPFATIGPNKESSPFPPLCSKAPAVPPRPTWMVKLRVCGSAGACKCVSAHVCVCACLCVLASRVMT